jgi:hypothetical protein
VEAAAIRVIPDHKGQKYPTEGGTEALQEENEKSRARSKAGSVWTCPATYQGHVVTAGSTGARGGVRV